MQQYVGLICFNTVLIVFMYPCIDQTICEALPEPILYLFLILRVRGVVRSGLFFSVLCCAVQFCFALCILCCVLIYCGKVGN